MPFWPRFAGTCRSLLGRGPFHREVDADVDACFGLLVDEHVARGASPAEARRLARLDMDGVEQVKESVRASRPAAWLDNVLRDLRLSLRLLAKTPGFSFIAVLVFALGIGANTAVFSLVDILLFQPLAGADRPGEVVNLYLHSPARPNSYRSFSWQEYEAIRNHGGVFSSAMAHAPCFPVVTDGEAARRTEAGLVSDTFFETLGVRLHLGRAFRPDEARPGSGARVMVLSDAGWKRMGAPADIIGRSVVVNSHPFTVVGVGPPGFGGPLAVVGLEFWLPLGAADLLAPASTGPPTPGARDAWGRDLMVVGRLRPGLSLDAATAALRSLSAGIQSARPGDEAFDLVTAGPRSRFNQGTSPERGDEDLVLPLGALMSAALIVLVIASLNVANMQLARGSARSKEIAMRLALGAGRGRVVSQLLTEGFVLALLGGAGGLVLAAWAMRLLVASMASITPMVIVASTAPDWRVCLAAFGFCAVAATVSGLGPAWRLSRLDILPEMKNPEGSGTGRRDGRFGPRNLLLSAQVTLSLALLAAAGLFVRSAIATGRADPGYHLDHQFLLRIDATPGGYDAVSGRAAYRKLVEHLRAVPGVESVSLASDVAFGSERPRRLVRRAGQGGSVADEAGQGFSELSFAVGADYFRTLGLPLLRGREFTETEVLDPDVTDVVVIDEPLAARLFPGRDALGQIVLVGRGTPTSPALPRRVVGVVPGVKNRTTDIGPSPHTYLPLARYYRPALLVHVRTVPGPRGDGADVRRAIRDAPALAGTRLAVVGLSTLAQARDASPNNWLVQTAGVTFGAFGAVALVMATVGLYGVKAYLVSRRTREIGIRMALGAKPGDVTRMVVGDGAGVLAVSGAAGLALALAMGRAVSSLLVGVSAFDPIVLLAATTALASAVLAAGYIPARRATRVSPVTALRAE